MRRNSFVQMALTGRIGVRLSGGGAAAAVPTDGLVAYWELDEESGTREDSFGSNDLTSVNSVGFAAGKINNAATFARSSAQKLDIASNANVNITGALSISAWVYVGAVDGIANGGLVTKTSTVGDQRQYWTDVTPSRNVRFICNAVGTNGTNNKILQGSQLTLERWYHLVAVFEPGEYMRIYIDGELDAELTTAVPAALYDGSARFAIGGYDGTDLACLTGMIDEVALYNRAITQTDVTALYGGGTPPPFSGNGNGAGDEGELVDGLIVSTSDGFSVGVPQNKAAFYDGTRYWMLYTESNTLKCRFGASLNNSMAQTGGDLVTNINNTGRSYAALFGAIGSDWYAWVLASRSGGNNYTLYRWQLTEAGLDNGISDAVSTSEVGWHLSLNHDYGGAAVGTLYAVAQAWDAAAAVRSNSAALDSDANGVSYDFVNCDFPEHTRLFKLSDGYLLLAVDQGGGDSVIDAYEVTKATIGDAWSAETALGFTDQNYAPDTSHAGQIDMAQLDTGDIFLAYCDDTSSNSGKIQLKRRGNAVASSWSTVSSDVIGGGGQAWHIAMTTDGADIWLFWLPDASGARGNQILYRHYDVSEATWADTQTLATVQSSHEFRRMFAPWRAANGKILAVWSELSDGVCDVMAAAIDY